MRISKQQRAKNTVLALNVVRLQKSVFSQPELIADLTAAGCPYPKRVPAVLLNLNLLRKEGKNLVFTSSDPIYFKQVEEAMHNISAAKKNVLAIPPLPAIPMSETDAAINFLKLQGFKILRPEYKEV